MDFEIVPQDSGEFLIRAEAHDGTASVTLALGEADAVSDGRLADDETTARATIRYLLEHQDAGDLPEQVQIGDVVAAYPDAIDRIADLRGEES